MVRDELSLELKLVMALTARGVRRQVLGQGIEPAAVKISAETSWQTVVKLIHRHNVLLHVLTGIDGCDVPSAVTQRLRNAARPLRMNAQLLKQELLRLAKLFEQSSLAMVSLKGPMLSEQLYRSVEFRFCNDLDLWVSAETLLPAQQLLLATGYQLTYQREPLTDAQFEQMQTAIAHHLNFWHPEKDIHVELHWRLFNDAQLLPTNIEEQMLDRSRQLVVGQHKLRVLTADDRLVYLCVHGSIHAWQQLRWLADVAAMLLLPDRDWAAWCAAVQRNGLARPVAQAFILIQKHGLAVLPQPCLELTATETTMKNLVETVELSWTDIDMAKSNVIGYFQRLFYLMQLRPEWRYKVGILRHLWAIDRDWLFWNLPSALFKVNYFLAPFVKLWRLWRERFAGRSATTRL